MTTILGFSGSLRRASYNSAALRAAQGVVPAGVSLTIFDRIGEMPLFDEDVEKMGMPEPVQAFREQIARADGVLIASPEYNFSIPGGLKNALDWASRGRDQPFNAKPVAIMGASMGQFGTARGQHHLRQTLVGVNAFVMPKPEVMIPVAQHKFDATGALVDDATREVIAKFVAGFVAWIERVK